MKPILASSPYPSTNQSGKVAPRASLALLGLCLIVSLAPSTSHSNICIPIFPEFDECDPSNGEPASYCGASNAGDWIVGKIQYELDLIQKRMVDKFERMRELIPQDPRHSQ